MGTRRGRPSTARTVSPSPERVPVGFALATLRREAGMAQEEVARRLGVSRVAVSHYESGTIIPSYIRLRRFLDCLGHDLRDLQDTLDEIEQRSPPPRRPGCSRAWREEGLLAEAEALFRSWQGRLPARQRPLLERTESEVMGSLRRLLVELGAREVQE